jgi:LysR family transcriptional activator of nhaA
MEWLNYHHLLYFWTVAKEGSIARACQRLHLAQPTISAQLQALERSLGEKLFNRVGRGLVLTETGHTVYRYADEIFNLGRELMDTLKGQPTGRPLRLAVGVADAVPKMVAYRLIEPAMKLPEPVHLVCSEGSPEHLLAELAIHRLDLVLMDSPIGPGVKIRAFNHQLGECGVTIFGTAEHAETYGGDFPRSLQGAPFLLPTELSTLRRSLDQWFDANGVRPLVVAEFEDSALMKSFGQAGAGLFAGPSVVEAEIERQYGVKVLGRISSLRERYYAVSVERKLKHPAVLAISESARRQLFVGA